MTERIHEPSPQRLQRARAEGHVATSAEFNSAVLLLAALVAGYLALPGLGQWLVDWTRDHWASFGRSIEPVTDVNAILPSMQRLIFGLAFALLPFLSAMLAIAVASKWMQTGPLWTPGRLGPDLRRVGPQRWWEQIRGFRWLATLVLGIPKIGIGWLILIASLWQQRLQLLQLPGLPLAGMIEQMMMILLTVSAQVCAAMLVLGLIDFGRQWFQHRDSLRMTEQERRDEARAQTGDSVNRLRRQRLNRI